MNVPRECQDCRHWYENAKDNPCKDCPHNKKKVR